MRYLTLIFLALNLSFCATQSTNQDLGKDDPNLWLENIEGEKALSWVKSQNTKTLDQVTHTKRYKTMEKQALEILQAKDKIPYVSMMGHQLYNFWQDKKNVRGLWRRTTLKNYKMKNPKWEVVLDLDELGKKEKENWVFKGANCLAPDFKRCLMNLSRGGKDAVVVREFDTVAKKFVSGGFELPEAKTWSDWIDKDHIFVATQFDKDSLTESGYSRIVKIWKRGTPLTQAREVLKGPKSDMAAFGQTFHTPEEKVTLVSRWETFYTTSTQVYRDGKLLPLPVPKSASLVGYFKGAFLLELRKDWKEGDLDFKQGWVVAIDKKVVENQAVTKKDVQVLYKPTQSTSVLRIATTSNRILLNTLENVTGKIYEIEKTDKGFSPIKPFRMQANTHLTLAATDSFHKDFFFRRSGFLNPDSLYHFNGSQKTMSKIKSLPAKFNGKGMIVKQMWAKSKDGTPVPYFVVGKNSVIKKGNAPTLLYGYGGFEVSLTPSYKPLVGKLWLEKGGVYVMANIRGGGEFGPRWHQAALKTNRQKAYDDFIAVGEDLVKNKLTTKEKLAIQGGSNGGLLVGAVMTQRPDLFKAVLCHVPLLDMIRYSQLLAGASWMAEYGDPRKQEMRDYLLSYSPYHNLSAEKKYPELFLMTSTKDDRVHPGHARKMAAKMMNMGHKNILYYENTEGGHAASANLKQKARMGALTYEFLFKTIADSKEKKGIKSVRDKNGKVMDPAA